MNLVPCSCGAQVPNDGGSVPFDVFGEPPCWARFGDVSERAERECADRAMWLGDAYEAQHAYGADMNGLQREVVWNSLARLAKRPNADARRTHERLVVPASIDVPPSMGSLTVFDVPLVAPSETFVTAIDAWVASVWKAWRNSHAALAKVGL